MINGLLNIKKETDYTSHDVVARLRGILKQKKIGHTGTLDPKATGVLPICLGRATKLCDVLTDTKKEYRVTFRLGIETDTEDIWGTVLEKKDDVKVKDDEVERVISSYIGTYEQVPPMYSAKKIDGKKLYELAREGKVIERKPSTVTIYSIRDIHMELPDISMTVECSKGTYIRSLCRDIGESLSTKATMTALIRTKASGFSIENSLTLSQIENLVKQNKLEDVLTPIDAMFLDLPALHVKESGYRLLYNGNPISKKLILEQDILANQIRIYDMEEHFIGIYDWNPSKQLYFPDKIFYIQS